MHLDRRPHATTTADRLPAAVIAWAVGYGALRVVFATGHHPRFRPLPTDLVVFTGWGAVALVGSLVLVTFLVLAVVVGVLAAIVPAIRASRMKVLDAIAHVE